MPKQIEAAQTLVEYLQSSYNIPAPNVGVHARLIPNHTGCPGKHFPAQAILGAGRVPSSGVSGSGPSSVAIPRSGRV